MPASLVLAAKALRDALCGFEPGLLSGVDCAAVVEELATTEKACAAARARAAVRASACEAHKDKGFADGADWLARTGGTSSVEAREAMETARALEDMPHTRAAMEKGELSLGQAHEIVRTERECPGSEAELVDLAKKESLRTLKEQARRRRHQAIDPDQLHDAQPPPTTICNPSAGPTTRKRPSATARQACFGVATRPEREVTEPLRWLTECGTADVTGGCDMATENRGRVRVEDGPKRVRTYLGGEVVADTTRPKLVWEIPNYPAYYFPVDDVRMELLTPTGRTERSPSRGEASYFTVKGGDREVTDAAWHYPDSPIEELRGLIRFDWEAMDAWFEEDEEVYVHPRDPYSRVDILASSRHVEVVVDGVKVADSHQPRLLFETKLPTRYYVPLTDVRLDLLRPSSTSTRCPYKGTAAYWSLEVNGQVHDDLVWIYRTPHLESVKIAGLACFFNERVDLYVDGVVQERPRTVWSKRS